MSLSASESKEPRTLPAFADRLGDNRFQHFQRALVGIDAHFGSNRQADRVGYVAETQAGKGGNAKRPEMVVHHFIDREIGIGLAGVSAIGALAEHHARHRLQDARLRQLRQRISVAYHLKKMSLNDTSAYIRHRLKVAGANGTPSFDGQSIQLIQKFSDGIPRQVNTACDMALLAAYSRELPDVSIESTKVAIEELEGVCQ